MGGWLAGNALLALSAAGLWGVGDFAGGMGVKAGGGTLAAALRLILLSHTTSLCVLLAVVWMRGDAFPHGWPLVWGLIAGTAVGVSLMAFYLALSRGAMGASAAVSGLLAAAIPAGVAMAVDGTPGWRKGAGFLVAGVAIWLIAAGESVIGQASSMWLASAAGAGFGIYFVALKFAGAAGVMWPLTTSRLGSLATCALLLVALRAAGTIGPAVPLTRTMILWVLGTALFDTTGNLMFVAATRAGRLDVAAVLGSLYPAGTILLAAWVMKERPTRRQIWGMAVAVGAVVLIAG